MPKTSPKSIVALVREQVDALDGFMAEVGLGVRNQRHVEELDEKLEVAIGKLTLARREGRYPVATRPA